MDRRKRLLVGVLLGAGIYGTVLASAAGLGGLTPGPLGAEDGVIASCDTDGVTTSYTTAYSTSGTAGYKVTGVTVSGLNDACDGKAIEIRLTGAADASLEAVSKTIETGAPTSTTATFAGTTLAESVIGIHVLISG